VFNVFLVGREGLFIMGMMEKLGPWIIYYGEGVAK